MQFFWRRKRASAAAADQVAPLPAPLRAPEQQTPARAAPPASESQPSAMRQVYALALDGVQTAQPADGPDSGQVELLQAASRELTQVGVESRYTPRRPSMLAQLLEALSDEEASLRELSRTVSKDAQLMGSLLRRANSAMFRVSSSPVESVERAAALLGTTGIRTLLAASLMQPLATGPAGGRGRFAEVVWEHSLYSASAAEAWAGRRPDADPFTAHLLCLVHGLGCVAVYRVLSDLYAARPALAPDCATIADALESNAALVAARIAAHWRLSERTQQALESQCAVAQANAQSPLSQALRFGLVAGAMTLLCRNHKLSDAAGLAAIEAGGFEGQPTPRIWDRLLLAYVRP